MLEVIHIVNEQWVKVSTSDSYLVKIIRSRYVLNSI